MSGEDAPRPCLENLIVPEIKTNKQRQKSARKQSLGAKRMTDGAPMLPVGGNSRAAHGNRRSGVVVRTAGFGSVREPKTWDEVLGVQLQSNN
jgi:hypothetical protein